VSVTVSRSMLLGPALLASYAEHQDLWLSRDEV
jgi:hypothetical protein